MISVVQIPRRFVASDWGGTETMVLQTSRQIRAAGHDVEIFTPDALSGAPREDAGDVRVRRFPYFYPYLGLDEAARHDMDLTGGNLFSFSLMTALLTRPRLDLIHLHTGKRLGGIGRLVARRRGLPYVISLHGGVYDVPAAEEARRVTRTRGSLEWGKALGLWVGSRRVLDDAAAILCVGAEEQARVQARHPRARVALLPNGVDAARFAQGDGEAFRRAHDIPRGAPLILTVGRVDPQKNQALALRALHALRDAHPSARLLLVGHVSAPAYQAKIQALAAELGVAGRVTLLPGLPAAGQALVDAFHAADVFLLPSTHEPFGIVLLEAWAAGLPVVASRVGGVPSFVEHGRDGLLFEPDDLGGATRALAALLADGPRARALAEAGRAKARERYGWDVISRQLIALYEEVLGAHPRRP
jgi:glycosyltransferase involved in cell wall biosynthesis